MIPSKSLSPSNSFSPHSWAAVVSVYSVASPVYQEVSASTSAAPAVTGSRDKARHSAMTIANIRFFIHNHSFSFDRRSEIFMSYLLGHGKRYLLRRNVFVQNVDSVSILAQRPCKRKGRLLFLRKFFPKTGKPPGRVGGRGPMRRRGAPPGGMPPGLALSRSPWSGGSRLPPGARCTAGTACRCRRWRRSCGAGWRARGPRRRGGAHRSRPPR